MPANRHYTIGKREGNTIEVIAAFNLPLKSDTLVDVVDNYRFIAEVKALLETFSGDVGKYEIYNRQDCCPITIIDCRGDRHEQ